MSIAHLDFVPLCDSASHPSRQRPARYKVVTDEACDCRPHLRLWCALCLLSASSRGGDAKTGAPATWSPEEERCTCGVVGPTPWVLDWEPLETGA